MYRILLALAIACILAATLTPAGTQLQPEFSRCLICGARGYSDAVVNVILFAPLGFTLALNGRRGWRPILFAGILSSCVELAQIVIPGRDPSLGDVTFNTLGATAGQALYLLGVRWAVPARRTAARLSAVAALLALGLFALTGYLLAPTFPRLPYFAWWTAARPEFAWYHGHVLDASIGPMSLHPTDHPLPPQVRSLLASGTPLSIEAVAGARVSSLAPLVSVEDRWRRDVLLVGVDRTDLVVRYRTRSAQWRLDGPDLRLRGALAGPRRSDTLFIHVRRAVDGYCIGMNHLEACHLWFTIGTGWAILMYPKHFPPWAQHLLDAGWVAGLVFPIGLWLRRRPESGGALVLLVAGLWLLPGAVALSSTTLREWIGAGCGLLVGIGLRAVLSPGDGPREEEPRGPTGAASATPGSG